MTHLKIYYPRLAEFDFTRAGFNQALEIKTSLHHAHDYLFYCGDMAAAQMVEDALYALQAEYAAQNDGYQLPNYPAVYGIAQTLA